MLFTPLDVKTRITLGGRFDGFKHAHHTNHESPRVPAVERFDQRDYPAEGLPLDARACAPRNMGCYRLLITNSNTLPSELPSQS